MNVLLKFFASGSYNIIYIYNSNQISQIYDFILLFIEKYLSQLKKDNKDYTSKLFVKDIKYNSSFIVLKVKANRDKYKLNNKKATNYTTNIKIYK